MWELLLRGGGLLLARNHAGVSTCPCPKDDSRIHTALWFHRDLSAVCTTGNSKQFLGSSNPGRLVPKPCPLPQGKTQHLCPAGTHALKLIMKDCVPRGVSRGEAQCQPAPPRDSLAHGQSDPTGLNRQEGDGKRAISSQLVVQGAPFRSSDPGSKARWTWWSVEGPLTTV